MKTDANTTDQQKRLVENLNKTFELLNTVLDLKLAYLRKTHPDMSEAELTKKIYLDIVKDKEAQWNALKT